MGQSTLSPPFNTSQAAHLRSPSSSPANSPASSPASFLARLLSRFNILSRYILTEIVTPFAIALFVFTGVLFLLRSLRLIDLVVNRDVPVLDIFLLFSYIVPRFLEVAIPMSMLIGIIFAFGRLSTDSELVVMRASGISLKELIRPVLVFAGIAFFATLLIGLWIRPHANYRLGIGVFEIAKHQASSGLVPGVFNDLGMLTIYAENVVNPGGQLKNTIITDRRDANLQRIFIARNGQIVADDLKRTITLRLYDGSIHEGSGLNYNVTYFDINNISLGEDTLLDENLARGGKKSDEMYIGELLAAIRQIEGQAQPIATDQLTRLAKYRVEFHRRLVLPFSCLCVAIVAMVLGIQPSRSGQSWGQSINIFVGILVIVGYYLLLATASALGEQGLVPPAIVMWIPNTIFLLLAWFLFRRMESEQWLAVSQALGSLLHRGWSRLQALRLSR